MAMNTQKSFLTGASLLGLLNPMAFLQRPEVKQRSTKRPRHLTGYAREEMNRRLSNKARIDDMIHNAMGRPQPALRLAPKVYSVSVRPSKDAMKAQEARYRARMRKRVERWMRSNPGNLNAPAHIRDWA